MLLGTLVRPGAPEGRLDTSLGSKSRYTSQLIGYISDKAIEFATRNRLDPHQTPRLRSEADTRREAHGRTDGRTDGRNNHL